MTTINESVALKNFRIGVDKITPRTRKYSVHIQGAWEGDFRMFMVGIQCTGSSKQKYHGETQFASVFHNLTPDYVALPDVIRYIQVASWTMALLNPPNKNARLTFNGLTSDERREFYDYAVL